MKSEFKRAMKLMWGEGGRFHYLCGWAIWKVLLVLVLVVYSEVLFWEGREFWKFRHLRPYINWQESYSSFNQGTDACLLFLFFAMYGGGRRILDGMGKWLRTSKLAKCVIIKGTIVNRLAFLCMVFIPCLVSRVCLICSGYKEYSKFEIFLVVWGAAYVLSVLGSVSGITLAAGYVLFMASCYVDDFWKFTTWFNLSTIGAVFIFGLCLIGGVLLEKLLLERTYMNRNS